MARVKRAMISRTRKKNLARRVKGFFLGHQRLRQAKEAMFRSEKMQFIGRKQRKRQFRALWVQRINAAVRLHGMSYSKFVHGMKLANIDLNRKVLSEMALHDPTSFAAVVKQAAAAVAAR
jgi:large subunit ribosomal protein L20